MSVQGGAWYTHESEVKFGDLVRMDWCEGAELALIWWSKIKVWGLKRIRYPRSPHLKICRLMIGGEFLSGVEQI